MSKWANDSVMDAALDVIDNGVTLSVCSAQPTNRTEAITTYKLASTTVDSGDFSKIDGSPSGRALVISEQQNLTVDTTGTATHLALCDGTDLLYVTTCVPQLLNSTNTITIPSWNITISDPS